MPDPLWVFGYGSLMWNPGFAVAEQHIARVSGFRRGFCMRSVNYRGTAAAPGLVLALDAEEGAACEGVAFRLKAGAQSEDFRVLREREMSESAYQERLVEARLANGQVLQVLAYVISPDHALYCGGLCAEEQAQIIAERAGNRGPNRDYLHNTVTHLGELGISDPGLEALDARVRALCGET
ncbi:gamma-glutamylcyclotransferase [Alphaproteobacteria bacterium KMM 3653]|uniref:glutathione-specific gamma-glutamylcyclotransferase n=1 Tax=Harenicola maris TaxID=2841044 RepID=A0AAP2CQM3_9RHOB|nr:gamma-glutamylcyclotransferase [Harenicola maris]